MTTLRAYAAGHNGNLPLCLFVFDGLRLFLRRLGSSWRGEWRRKANEAKEDQDWKLDVEQRLLPVQVHDRLELVPPEAISRRVVERQHVVVPDPMLGGDGCIAAAPHRGCSAHAERR